MLFQTAKQSSVCVLRVVELSKGLQRRKCIEKLGSSPLHVVPVRWVTWCSVRCETGHEWECLISMRRSQIKRDAMDPIVYLFAYCTVVLSLDSLHLVQFRPFIWKYYRLVILYPAVGFTRLRSVSLVSLLFPTAQCHVSLALRHCKLYTLCMWSTMSSITVPGIRSIFNVLSDLHALFSRHFEPT